MGSNQHSSRIPSSVSSLLTACLFVVVLLLSSSTRVADAKKKDRNTPHPHRGKLSPWQPGPFPDVALSSKDESTLANGQPIMKQTMPDPSIPIEDQSGGAICIQDVAAPKDAVWNQILSLDQYKGKVQKVQVSKNYAVSHNKKDNTHTIKTRMVLGVLPGYSYESYYDHKFHPNDDSLTWTLDYDKTSDFDDVAGHWHVDALSETTSRVYYACDIKMFSAGVPKPIMNYISKAALKQATGWVKRESEKHPDGTLPSQFATATNQATTASTKQRGGGGAGKENTATAAAVSPMKDDNHNTRSLVAMQKRPVFGGVNRLCFWRGN